MICECVARASAPPSSVALFLPTMSSDLKPHRHRHSPPTLSPAALLYSSPTNTCSIIRIDGWPSSLALPLLPPSSRRHSFSRYALIITTGPSAIVVAYISPLLWSASTSNLPNSWSSRSPILPSCVVQYWLPQDLCIIGIRGLAKTACSISTSPLGRPIFVPVSFPLSA